MLADLQPLSTLVGTVSWVAVYVLMTRRGLKDRSYGMPMVALCLNLAWEFNFTFLTSLPVVYRVGNGAFLAFDFGVLYTCFRFGPEDFDWPVLRRQFRPILLAVLAASLVGTVLFVRAFADDYGVMAASVIIPLYSGLLVAMLLRRDGVRGQSFPIVLLILLGDLGGWIPVVYAHQQGWTTAPLLWIYTSQVLTLVLNVIYVLLYVHIARRDGVPLLRRL